MVLVVVVMMTSHIRTMDSEYYAPKATPKLFISDDKFSEKAMHYLKKRVKEAIRIKRFQREFWKQARESGDPFDTTKLFIKKHPECTEELPYTIRTEGLTKQIIEINEFADQQYKKLLGRNHIQESPNYYPFHRFYNKFEASYQVSIYQKKLLANLTIVFEMPFKQYQHTEPARDEFEKNSMALTKEIGDLKKGIRDCIKATELAQKLASKSCSLNSLDLQKTQDNPIRVDELDFVDSPRKQKKLHPTHSHHQKSSERSTRPRSQSVSEGLIFESPNLDIINHTEKSPRSTSAGKVRLPIIKEN